MSVGLETYGDSGVVSFATEAQIRLLKLHGSLDWQFPDDVEERRDYQGRGPFDLLGNAWLAMNRNGIPIVLESSSVARSFRRQDPSWIFFTVFANELASVDRLITIGYAFRDDPINRLIVQFMMRRSTARLRVVSPALPGEYVVLVDLLKRFPGRIRIKTATAKDALSEYPMPIE